MVFVREEQAYPDLRVDHAIRVASWFYPNWSDDLARQLLADFDVPPRRRIKRLSRGMRSAVGIVIGLAAFVAGRTVWHRQRLGSRASVTIADPLDLAAQARARTLHLSLEPLSLQQLLVHAAGAAYGLGLTLLQAVERATGGWGLSLHFFRIPWIMDGPWYQTWLTSFVLLVAFFLYGMWYGLVYRRWSLPGEVIFIAAGTGQWSGPGNGPPGGLAPVATPAGWPIGA